jgi:hypothetical protein
MSTTPPSADLINNAWKMSTVFAQNTDFSSRQASMLLQKLVISQMSNRHYLRVASERVRQNGLQKAGLAVKLQYRKRKAYGSGLNLDGSICETTPGTEYVTKSYYLDRKVEHTITVSQERYRCIELADREQFMMDLAEAYSDLTDRFANSVESQLYSKNADGSYKYIGKLPSYQGIAQTPRDYGTLAVLEADGKEINLAGWTSFENDMRAVGVREWIALGGSRLEYFSKLAGVSSPNQRGFNLALLDIMPETKTMHSELVYPSFRNDALGRPMVVIEDGSIYIASAPYYDGSFPETQLEAGTRRYSIPHPTLPNIFINIEEKVVDSCDSLTIPEVIFNMSIVYTIIARGECDYDAGFHTLGDKGLYLYYLQCSDDSGCDLPEYFTQIPDDSQPFNKNCNVDLVCAAEQPCSMSLSPMGIQEIGGLFYAVFNATFKPSGGSVQDGDIQWQINGVTVVGQTTNILNVLVDDLVDGDVITAAAADTAECEALAPYVVTDLPDLCGTLRAVLSGTFAPVLNGGTIALGDIVQDAVTTNRVNISALGFDINVASAVRSGTSATLTISPSLPATLTPSGGDISLDLALNTGTIGAAFTTTVTITSDACDAEFEYTVTWNVVAP